MSQFNHIVQYYEIFHNSKLFKRIMINASVDFNITWYTSQVSTRVRAFSIMLRNN